MNTTARIKQSGKNFEIVVDLDKALEFKKSGRGNDFLESDSVFADSKKGMVSPQSELEEAFGTTDVNEIAEKIVKNGEVLVSQEHRDGEREKKYRQVVEFLSKNAIDPQSGNAITSERIKSALEQAGVNVKNGPVESQVSEIIESLAKIMPIKLKVRKIKLTIPAAHTGKIYGLVNQYKENEVWLSDGNLEVVVAVPEGIVMDFYDRLNLNTHGSVISQDVNE